MAKAKWGRNETVIWPPHSPIYTYGAVFLAIVLTGLFLYCRFSFGNTPLQRFYTPIYLRSTFMRILGKTRHDKYRMLFVSGRTAPAHLAANTDVIDGKTPEVGGKFIPLALSPIAVRHGSIFLFRGPEQIYSDALLSAYLQRTVYDGNNPLDLYKLPLLFGFLSLMLQLPFTIRRDIRRCKELKYDRRLKGTEHAHLIDPNAPQQRAGILGSLGLVADSLRLLPKKGEGNGEWSATEWAETRQGWVFITSLPAEREALRPLQSLWIDLLVLRLLNEPKDGQKRAWFVIDELHQKGT